MKCNTRETERGFTLVELLVVIAAIGLFSTLAVVALASAREKTRDAKRVSDVKQVQTALALYFAEKGGHYPNATNRALGRAGATKLCSDGFADVGQGREACDASDTMFLGSVPRDPSNPEAPCTETSSDVCDALYNRGENDTTYFIRFYLEGVSGELRDQLNCATPDGIKSGATCP